MPRNRSGLEIAAGKLISAIQKSLISALIGMIFGAILSLLVYSELAGRMTDDNKAQSGRALHETSEIRERIKNELLNDGYASDYFYTSDEIDKISPVIKILYRGRDGNLIMKLSSGALIWLYPERKDGTIIWRCFGGSDRDLSISCRKKTFPMDTEAMPKRSTDETDSP